MTQPGTTSGFQHRPTRREAIGILSTITLGTVAGAQEAAGQTSAVPLRVALTAVDAYAEPFYAQDLGLFAKAGIAADLQLFSSGTALASAVAGGAADVGVSNPVALAHAFERGLPFVIFAGGGLYSSAAPTVQLIVQKNSPITTAKDVENKTVGVLAIGDMTQLGTIEWLQHNGADPSKVKFIEIGWAQMAASLDRNSIDVGILTEPLLTAAKASGAVRVLANQFDVIAPQFSIGAFFTTRTYLAQNAALMKRFTSAIYAAGDWANANPQKSAVILAKYAKLDPEHLKHMARARYPMNADPKQFSPVLTVMEEHKLLAKPINAADMIAQP
jgi:NitT/TauT family transport system substrate-binding protein